MKKNVAILLVLFMMLSTLLFNTYASEDDDASASTYYPVKSYMGDWYYGGNYSYGEGDKPVLVFIHGAGDSAQNWYTSTVYHGWNSMYDRAYREGYRTAFVNKGYGSNWDNGHRIAAALDQICMFFGVQKVNIIAHSKGGIDTNTAIAFYGSDSRVNNVMTLATPHWGSHLADVAGAWYLRPLMIALRQYSGETNTLKTANMRYFRQINDSYFLSRDRRVSYLTIGGTSKGPSWSALRQAGNILAWLSPQSNDGLVPLSSTYKPYSRRITTQYWDHDNIRHGYYTWYWISQYASAKQRIFEEESSDQFEAVPVSANSIYRGDFIDNSAEAVIPVDNTVSVLSLDIMTSDEAVEIQLIQPDGNLYVPEPDNSEEPDFQIFNDDNDNSFFKGAIHNTYKIENPMQGKWTVKLDSEESAAYAVIASYESNYSFEISQESLIFEKGQAVPVSIDLSPALASCAANASATATLTRNSFNGDVIYQDAIDLSVDGAKMTANASSDLEPGLYTVDVVIKGVSSAGLEFERAGIYTIVVTPEGDYDPIEFSKSISE